MPQPKNRRTTACNGVGGRADCEIKIARVDPLMRSVLERVLRPIRLHMNDETYRDFLSHRQAKLREEFRQPDFDAFSHRSPVPLPSTVREFFTLGEQLYGSCFEIDCGTSLCVQYFCPLGVTSIDACERSGWRFVDIGAGCDGEDILVSLGNKQSVFVGWSAFSEPPEDIGVDFASFLGSLVRLLSGRVP